MKDRIHIEGIPVDCYLVPGKDGGSSSAALKVVAAPLRKDAVNRTNLDTRKSATFIVAVNNIPESRAFEYKQISKNVAQLREEFKKNPERNSGSIAPHAVIIDAAFTLLDISGQTGISIDAKDVEVINLGWDKDDRRYNPKRNSGNENSASVTVIAVKETPGKTPETANFLVATGSGGQDGPKRQVVVGVDKTKKPKVYQLLSESVRSGSAVAITGPMKIQAYQSGKDTLSVVYLNAVKANAVKMSQEHTKTPGKKNENGPKM